MTATSSVPTAARVPTAREVAGVVVRLKLRLLRNTWRADVWQLVATLLGYLMAAGAATALVAVATGLRFADADVAAVTVTAVGTAAALAWTVMPLLTFGLDSTVDPARFAELPVRAGTLLPGVLVAGVVGPPGLATLIGALATTITWARGPEVALAPLAAVVGTATCVALARVVTTAAAGILTARRGREAAAVILALLLSTAGLVPIAGEALADRIAEEGVSAESVAGVLGWTPFGAAWAVPGTVAMGHPWRALGQAALALAVLGGLLAWWRRLLARALEAPPSASVRKRDEVRTGLFDRLPGTPAGAVAARTLLSFRRDSRFLLVLAAPVVLMVVLTLTTRDGAFGPVMGLALGAFTVGLTAANWYGYDGTAFAAHLVTGVPGAADVRGRTAALLAVGVPVVGLGAVLAATVGRQGDNWPIVAAMGLGVFLITTGVGVVSSVLAPYPVPEAGSNPFAARSNGGLRPFLFQLALMGVLSVCITPPLLVAWWVDTTWVRVVATAAMPVLGIVVLVVGVQHAGSVYARRGPEILAAIRRT